MAITRQGSVVGTTSTVASGVITQAISVPTTTAASVIAFFSGSQSLGDEVATLGGVAGTLIDSHNGGPLPNMWSLAWYWDEADILAATGGPSYTVSISDSASAYVNRSLAVVAYAGIDQTASITGTFGADDSITPYEIINTTTGDAIVQVSMWLGSGTQPTTYAFDAGTLTRSKTFEQSSTVSSRFCGILMCDSFDATTGAANNERSGLTWNVGLAHLDSNNPLHSAMAIELTEAPPTFATVVAATSTVTANLHTDFPRFSTTVAATSTVTPSLARLRPFSSTVAVTSTVTPALSKEFTFASTVAATSAVTARTVTAPFPTVISRTSGVFATDTSHTINFPEHKNGDHLVVVFNHLATSFINIITNGAWATGWRTLGYTSDFPVSGSVYHKVATSFNSDPSLTIDLSATQPASYVAFVIRNGNNISMAIDEIDATGGTTVTFPTLDLAKQKSALWIAGYGSDENQLGITTEPANYTNLTSAFSGTAGLPFTQTMERELFADVETPATATIIGGSNNRITFSIAVWGDEVGELTHTFSWGDFQADPPFDSWVGTEVRTSGAGSIGALNLLSTERLTFGDASGSLALGAGFPTDGVVSDSYAEWSGTFESLSLIPGTKVLGYSAASFYYNPRFYTNPVVGFMGDDIGTRGSFSLDDGTVRTLIGNQPDPGASGTLFRASDPVNISGLALPSSTPISLRINTHFDSVLASGGSATFNFDEVSLTMLVVPPITIDPSNIAIEQPNITVTDRPYPIVTATSTGSVDTALLTPEVVNLPAHVTGQMLLVHFYGNNVSQIDGTWTLVVGGNGPLTYFKIATSGSETLTVDGFLFDDVTSSGGGVSYIAHAISNATEAVVSRSVSDETSLQVDWVTRAHLAIANYHDNGSPTSSFPASLPSGPPVGFENFTTAGTGEANYQYMAQANKIFYGDTLPPFTWPGLDIDGINGPDVGATSAILVYSKPIVDSNLDTTTSIDWAFLQSTEQDRLRGVAAGQTYREWTNYGNSSTVPSGGRAYGWVWDLIGVSPEIRWNQSLYVSGFNIDWEPTHDQTVFVTKSGTFEDLGVPPGHAVTSLDQFGFSEEASQTNWRFSGTAGASADLLNGDLIYYTTPYTLRLKMDYVDGRMGWYFTGFTWAQRDHSVIYGDAGSFDPGADGGPAASVSGSSMDLETPNGVYPLVAAFTNADESNNSTFFQNKAQVTATTGNNISGDLYIYGQYAAVDAVLFEVTDVAYESPDVHIVIEVKPTPTNVAIELPDVHIELRLAFDPTDTAIESPDFDVIELLHFASDVTVTAAVTPSLARVRPFETTVAATSAVTGNIVEGLRFLTTVVAESATIIGEVDRLRPFESTIAAVSTVEADLFRGYAADITVQSGVTSSFNVARDMATPISVAAAVTANANRAVVFGADVTITSSTTVQPFERDVAFVAVTNAVASASGSMGTEILFAIDPINVQSAVTSNIGLTVNFAIDPINVQSAVTGNIDETKRFMSTTVAQSAVINSTLARLVNEVSNINVVSDVQPAMVRLVNYVTTIIAQSGASATMVVITNTLEVTFTETYFQEISPFVVQLVTDTVDFVVVVNELDEIVLPTTELLDDVTITTTTDDGPA